VPQILSSFLALISFPIPAELFFAYLSLPVDRACSAKLLDKAAITTPKYYDFSLSYNSFVPFARFFGSVVPPSIGELAACTSVPLPRHSFPFSLGSSLSLRFSFSFCHGPIRYRLPSPPLLFTLLQSFFPFPPLLTPTLFRKRFSLFRPIDLSDAKATGIATPYNHTPPPFPPSLPSSFFFSSGEEFLLRGPFPLVALPVGSLKRGIFFFPLPPPDACPPLLYPAQLSQSRDPRVVSFSITFFFVEHAPPNKNTTPSFFSPLPFPRFFPSFFSGVGCAPDCEPVPLEIPVLLSILRIYLRFECDPPPLGDSIWDLGFDSPALPLVFLHPSVYLSCPKSPLFLFLRTGLPASPRNDAVSLLVFSLPPPR